jgi:hypothetical protein
LRDQQPVKRIKMVSTPTDLAHARQLAKFALPGNLCGEMAAWRSFVLSRRSASAGPATDGTQWQRLATFGWLPIALLGAGIVLGLVLWSKWGFAVAFEAIRAYCF